MAPLFVRANNSENVIQELSELLLDKTTINTLVILSHIKDVIQGKAKIGKKRSSKWPAVRKAHLQKFPTCAVCGGTKKVEVHHIISFSVDPSKELEPTNLITLCEGIKSCNHHLHFGHLGDYKKINPDVVEDAAYWNKKLTGNYK